MGRSTGVGAGAAVVGGAAAAVVGTGPVVAGDASPAGVMVAFGPAASSAWPGPPRSSRTGERSWAPLSAAKRGAELPAPLTKRPRTATKVSAFVRRPGLRLPARRTAPTPPDEA